jgi:hypothetical protein
MFCPKCGSQNGEETKFCRGCGADLSNVMTSLEPKPKKQKGNLAERSVALYSRGVRGVFTSIAFVAVTVIMTFFVDDVKGFWLIPLTLAFIVMAGAISRFVQASGYRKLAAKESPAQLGASRTEYLEPARSFYETDDLAVSPFSVTERTTNLLQRLDVDDE